MVFISSESAIQIPVEMIHYGMTKIAQLAISRGLAKTCAGTGVTVNAVLPGPTSFEEARPSSLLKRFTTPDEVAHLVVYVCSGLSSATTGAALRANVGVVRAVI